MAKGNGSFQMNVLKFGLVELALVAIYLFVPHGALAFFGAHGYGMWKLLND